MTTKVGIVGCGNICGHYVGTLCDTLDGIDVVACADIKPEAAEAVAVLRPGIQAVSVEELLADPDIDMVINLTIPDAHAAVNLAILEADKHAYSEKPLATNREDGKRILAAAAAKGLRIGCAPDTFFGSGAQTCRKLIDDGAIGKPVAAFGQMAGRGPGNWHPNPFFFYQKGAGPLFDIGPYPITALVNLVGPVARVCAMARRSAPERPITEGDHKGQVIPIDVETHVSATLEFESGTVMTLIQSYDLHAHALPRLEIYGADGAIQAPDPNGFSDKIRHCPGEGQGWNDVEALPGYCNGKHRGLGAGDMALAIANDRPHRASGEMAYHVLDVMCAIIEASDQGRQIEIESTCVQPEPLASSLDNGKLVR